MLKKSLTGIIIIMIVVIFIMVGIHKYIDSTTTFEYGQLPDDEIPEKFEKVTYTIPTIDEKGNGNSQTFTIDNNEQVSSNIVKLVVRNDKVKNHKFIDKKDVPQYVRENWPRENF